MTDTFRLEIKAGNYPPHRLNTGKLRTETLPTFVPKRSDQLKANIPSATGKKNTQQIRYNASRTSIICKKEQHYVQKSV